MSNKKLSWILLALAVADAIIFLITNSSVYLFLAVINLCAGLAGVVKNRWIFLMFGLVSLAGMIYLFVLFVKAIF